MNRKTEKYLLARYARTFQKVAIFEEFSHTVRSCKIEFQGTCVTPSRITFEKHLWFWGSSGISVQNVVEQNDDVVFQSGLT